MSPDETLADPGPAGAPCRLLAIIFVLALLLRLTFLTGVLSAHDTGGLGHLNGDSTEYLHLGLNLAGAEGFTTDHLRSRLKGLARPPLYPLLLAGPISLLGPEPVAGQAWTIPPAIAWRIDPDQGYDSEFRLTERMRAPLVAVFLLQAVGDALLAVLTGWLAFRLTCSRLAAGIAGGVMAFNITGIGLSATILADGPFALLCFAGLCATILAADRVREGRDVRAWLLPAICAAGFWAVAQLTKPALTFWPAGLVVGWIILNGRHAFFRRKLKRRAVMYSGSARFSGRDQVKGDPPAEAGRAAAKRHLQSSGALISGGIIIMGLATAIGGWTLRNYLVEGLATPSIITERNLRYMIQPDVAVLADFGRKPRPSERSKYYWRYAKRDLGLETAPGMTPAQWVRGQRHRAVEVLELYPSLVVKVYFRNLENVITEPWDLFYEQVPTPGSPYAPNAAPGRWTALVRLGFSPLQMLDEVKVVHWAAAVLAFAGPLVCLLVRKNSSPSGRGGCAVSEAREADGEGSAPLSAENEIRINRAKPSPPRSARHLSQGERRPVGRLRPLFLLWGFCLYLVLLSGTTRDQGSRILYPAHAPAVVLVITCAAWLARPIGSAGASPSRSARVQVKT